MTHPAPFLRQVSRQTGSILAVRLRGSLRRLVAEWPVYLILLPVEVGGIGGIFAYLLADARRRLLYIDETLADRAFHVVLFFILLLSVSILEAHRRGDLDPKRDPLLHILPVDRAARFMALTLVTFLSALLPGGLVALARLASWRIAGVEGAFGQLMGYLFSHTLGITAMALLIPLLPIGKGGAGRFLCVLGGVLLILHLGRWWSLLGPLVVGIAFLRDLTRETSPISGKRRFRAGWGARTIRGICRLLPADVRPLVVRDLLLVVRRSSPAFLMSPAFSLLVVIGLTLLVPWVDPSRNRGDFLLFVGCMLAVYAQATQVSSLLRFELPYLWVERTLAVPFERFWRAKVYGALLLALPVPFLLFWPVYHLHPEPIDLLVTMGRLIVETVFLATAIGGMVFLGEKRHPALGKILALPVALIVTGLTFLSASTILFLPIALHGFQHLSQTPYGNIDPLGAASGVE